MLFALFLILNCLFKINVFASVIETAVVFFWRKGVDIPGFVQGRLLCFSTTALRPHFFKTERSTSGGGVAVTLPRAITGTEIMRQMSTLVPVVPTQHASMKCTSATATAALPSGCPTSARWPSCLLCQSKSWGLVVSYLAARKPRLPWVHWAARVAR